MSSKAFYPFIFLNVPNTDFFVFPGTRKILSITADGQCQYLVRVTLDVEWICSLLSFSFGIQTLLVKRGCFLTSPKVPFVYGTVFRSREEVFGVFSSYR